MGPKEKQRSKKGVARHHMSVKLAKRIIFGRIRKEDPGYQKRNHKWETVMKIR